MQATTSPKVVDQRPALQVALAAILIAAALAVGGALGIALQQSAPATPVVGDYEASGLRNAPAISAPSDRFLDGAAFRRAHAAAAITTAPTTGGLVWMGTNPGVPADAGAITTAPTTGGLVFTGTNPGVPAGTVADDQMSSFNGFGLSKPGADESEKVGRAHR